MIRWGLDPERPILAVIDGGKAIRSALKATFVGWVLIARCREHKRRNVLDHVPVAERAFIGRKLDKAWKQTDAVKGGAGAAGTHQQLQAAHPVRPPACGKGLRRR